MFALKKKIKDQNRVRTHEGKKFQHFIGFYWLVLDIKY